MTQMVPKSVLDLADNRKVRPGHQTIEILLQPSFTAWFSLRIRLLRDGSTACDMSTWFGTPADIPILGLQPTRNIRAALEFRRRVTDRGLKDACSFLRQRFDVRPRDLLLASRGELAAGTKPNELVALLAAPGEQRHFSLPLDIGFTDRFANAPPTIDGCSLGPFTHKEFAVADGMEGLFAWNTTGWGQGSVALHMAETRTGRNLVRRILQVLSEETMENSFDELVRTGLRYLD